MNWISVKDKLPNPSEPLIYLVVTDEYDSGRAIDTAWYVQNEKINDGKPCFINIVKAKANFPLDKIISYPSHWIAFINIPMPKEENELGQYKG